MPEKRTLRRAAEDKRQGKAPTIQAGEFVREEMEHVKNGKLGLASRKQAIAIGLSEARRAGVDLKPPKKGEASAATRKRRSGIMSEDAKTQAAGRRQRPARLPKQRPQNESARDNLRPGAGRN